MYTPCNGTPSVAHGVSGAKRFSIETRPTVIPDGERPENATTQAIHYAREHLARAPGGCREGPFILADS